MLHIDASATMLPEKKGSDAVPIKIGTRGTVGNLLMKEIEYFKRLDTDSGGDRLDFESKSLDPNRKNCGSGGLNFWSGFGFLKIKWRGKKTKGSSNDKFLPRVCTMVDVADSHHNHHHCGNKIPGFNYQNLPSDSKTI
uniref:uncharacterized protein LOC122597049 n=1 Tax=Erigeron canadensis TaxID=72917 RepID=UPI001CB9A355|nr:uncharacterized protein LOC122597049 [Erigeron canadensis]